MLIELHPHTVHKRFALTISRGTNKKNQNLAVGITADGITGWGEAVPFSIGSQTQSFEQIKTAIEAIIPQLAAYHPLQQQAIDTLIATLPSAARAAIDIARYDWLGKSVNLPLWKLWGLEREKIVPISVTVGISSPADARARIHGWLEVFDARFLKIKLGNPAGIGADRAMMEAIKDEMPKRTYPIAIPPATKNTLRLTLLCTVDLLILRSSIGDCVFELSWLCKCLLWKRNAIKVKRLQTGG